MAYARSSPIGFHHPFLVDLDLDLDLDLGHLARAYAAEQRRQEWEYAQHVMHLRRQQQQEQERAHARKLRAAAEEQEELRRCRRHQQQVVEALAAAELDRRRRQQQAEFQLYLQQQQQQQQQRARQVQRQQRRRLQAQRGAAAAATAAGRRRPLSHVLGSLVPSAVDQLYYDGGLHLRDDRVSPDEDEEAAVAQSSPVEILFQLLGEQGHRQDEDDSEEEEEEEVVLKPTQPLSLGVADPEEVDLAAAAFAADAADTADEAEQEDTAFEEEEESASESSTDDHDFEADRASADEDATPGLLEEEGAHAAHNAAAAAAAAAAALDSLAALAQDFTARRRSFVSPAALSFQPATSATPTSTSGSTALRSPTPPLAFESNNTPFLGYEDFLVSLLSRIDAVESHGVREVRRARKNLVREVEQELARLDDLKDRAWERLSASSASPSSASEVSSDEAEDTEMTPEPVQGLTPDEPSTFDLELDLDSASDSEASGMHVKVPFSVRRSATSSSRSPRRSRVRTGRPRRSHPREGTPALSNDASSSSSSTDNVDDEQVADILLHARRLGEQVAQLEEAERDQQKSKRQVDADADSSSESEDEDDELVLVYF